MATTFPKRAVCLAAALGFNLLLAPAVASADLETVVGARVTVQNEPVTDCSAKARTALDAVLQNAIESEDGSGEWLAYGALDSSGTASAAATIHCYRNDAGGYVATITCAAEVPPNPETATALCAKVAAAFPGQNAAANAPPARGREDVR